MEVLTVIGIIVLILVIFTGGGILGWILKGLGAVFNFLMQGWWSCLSVIFWIFIILVVLAALV